MIYCTLLNPAIDCVYTIDSFVSGSILRDVPCRTYPAGKGINVACVSRILGEEVCVIAAVPDRDRGRFAHHLESNGIRHHLFPTTGEARLNTTIIEQNSGLTSHINSCGPQLSPRIQEEFLQFMASHISAGDLWCFSGSIPPGFDDTIYARMVKSCKNAGNETFLDTRGNALRHGVQAKPTTLKPNSTELEDLFGEKIRGVHHMALKGKKLLDKGVSHIFISLGSDGLIALHDNDCLLCVPPPVKPVDTIGCGDALMAGILVAWARKFSFTETCRLAVACGTSKVIHSGPHTVTREEVWQLMEDVKITAI